ncbi:MAG TPA: DUF5947 family protein [Rugosimonospora sp.]|nr:DUF5947 family protein [Rugosimonospora sp.]
MSGVGLRRFARPSPTPAPVRQPAPDVERCEMCATPLDGRHSHVVDLEKRSLACACRACYLLFTVPGAGRGRYRAVPEDVYQDPEHPLGEMDWDALQVPVGTAFFFANSNLGRVVGCYPSPGGATECELDLAAWRELAGRYPMIGSLTPDVEAVFVSRTNGIEYFLVPIDRCYALVGEVRLRWRGLDGGQEVRDTLAAFLAGLRAQCRVWSVA